VRNLRCTVIGTTGLKQIKSEKALSPRRNPQADSGIVWRKRDEPRAHPSFG